MDKDGNKTGGRKAGTPNKTTTKVKQAISDLLSVYVNTTPEDVENSEDGSTASMMRDFARVKPIERLMIAEKMMQYVMPKMQSVAVDAEITDKQKKNAERLAELAKLPEESK